MADRINGSVCLNHPNTPAVKRCAVCSKPLCEECVQMHDGVPYCSDLCYENAKRTGMMVDDVQARKKSANMKAFIRKIIYLVIVVALALGGYCYYKNHKGEIDSSLKKGTKVLKDSEKKVKDSVNDSKYLNKSKSTKKYEKMVNE